MVSPLLDKSESNDISVAPMAPLSPQFQLRWQRGELTLSGHTASLQHEQDLLQVAQSSYPEDPVISNFRPLGIVPPYWEDMTLQVLYLLAESAYAQADLSADKIKIRGITVDHSSWQSRFDALKNTLPPHISVTADILPVDPAVSVTEVCTRAFLTFESGAINFDESSTNFRSSAYPRLDRVIALANACHNSRISITGYTDSSGDASRNQRLSLQRANAVGDYIVDGGVERARLLIAGAGSSAPIGDDSTRYGRSLNRRIEIKLSSIDKTIDALIRD
jgi:outer membrane protein OmpA-like peptidoglycan-associated protein